MKQQKLFLTIIVTFIACSISGCNRKQDEHRHDTHHKSSNAHDERTTISEEAAKSLGIATEQAKPIQIKTSLSFNGQIEVDPFKVSALTARYPGIVKEIRKLPGDKVNKGDVILTIESNESLKVYELLSPKSGEILDLKAAVGSMAENSTSIATVGDLSSVWVEISVPQSEFSILQVGQKVIIDLGSSIKGTNETIEGQIKFLSPLADRDSQTRLVRIEALNPKNLAVPGLFVRAKVVIQERHVPVAVKAEALQKFKDQDVVFKKVGQVFEIAVVRPGEIDGDWVEIKDGLSAEDHYVTKNSFVIKADIMKSGASHDH